MAVGPRCRKAAVAAQGVKGAGRGARFQCVFSIISVHFPAPLAAVAAVSVPSSPCLCLAFHWSRSLACLVGRPERVRSVGRASARPSHRKSMEFAVNDAMKIVRRQCPNVLHGRRGLSNETNRQTASVCAPTKLTSPWRLGHFPYSCDNYGPEQLPRLSYNPSKPPLPRQLGDCSHSPGHPSASPTRSPSRRRPRRLHRRHRRPPPPRKVAATAQPKTATSSRPPTSAASNPSRTTASPSLAYLAAAALTTTSPSKGTTGAPSSSPAPVATTATSSATTCASSATARSRSRI